MKRVFLILAIVGAILPYLFFTTYLLDTGFSLTSFLGALFVNGVAAGITADLLFSSFVFWLFMAYRRGYRSGPSPLLFIVLNLLIGLSCALPAYLYAITPEPDANLAA